MNDSISHGTGSIGSGASEMPPLVDPARMGGAARPAASSKPSAPAVPTGDHDRVSEPIPFTRTEASSARDTVDAPLPGAPAEVKLGPTGRPMPVRNLVRLLIAERRRTAA